MKITLKHKNRGERFEIDTDKQWFHFRANDIITLIGHEGQWLNQRVIVQGVVNMDGAEDMAGIIEGQTDFLHTGAPRDPQGLILLSRPSWRFKVGDRVLCIDTTLSAHEKTGTVIVLNPPKKTNDYQYLVEFDDWHTGNDGNQTRDWDKPWYPQQHKTASASRFWCSDDMIALESAPPTPPAERFQTVTMMDGAKWEIDTHGTRHGFRAGDTYWMRNAPSNFSSKTFTVLGTKKSDSRFMIIRSHDDDKIYNDGNCSRDSPPPNSTILLSRHGARFKVGDEVRVLQKEGGALTSWSGVVRALDPESDREMKHLVDGYPRSNKLPNHFMEKFWFPLEMTDKDVAICTEQELSFVREPVAEATVNASAEKEIPAQNEAPDPFLTITAKSLFAELIARVEKGELPIFDPQLLALENDQVVDFGKTELARNMQECLHKLGATLFHLLVGESEFNHLKYEADPLENYEARMPSDVRGELIRFLLFGNAKTVAEVETKFPWLTTTEKTLDPSAPFTGLPVKTVSPAIARPGGQPRDVIQEALAKIVEAGLDNELAMKILNDPGLAEFMITTARIRP